MGLNKYKPFSDCNYLVSIKDVMHSERKLPIKELLRLFTASKGVLTVSDFIASFGDNKTDKQDFIYSILSVIRYGNRS